MGNIYEKQKKSIKDFNDSFEKKIKDDRMQSEKDYKKAMDYDKVKKVLQ